jgi:GntR family transcriptional regulator
MANGYEGIADELRAAIHRGDYPPRAFLPTEEELAKRYQVAIGTIRRATDQLQAEGLIDKTRRGSEVKPRKLLRLLATRYDEITPGAGPWERACAEQGYVGNTVVLAVEQQPAPDGIAEHLGIPPGSPVVRRDNHMKIGDEVLQLQTTWLPLAIAEGTPLAKLGKVVAGIYGGLIAAGHRPATAMDTVTSHRSTKEQSEVFGLRIGSPVSHVHRTTFNAAGTAIVHVHLVVNADRVSLGYPQTLSV